MKKIGFLVLVFLFVYANVATAHKVSAYAYREGEKIIGECYFVDGSPCKNSKVEVYDTKGKKITEALTDEKGEFSFKTTETGALKILIPAGEGHRAKYIVEAVKKPEKKEIKKIGLLRPSEESSQVAINKEELREIIDEAIETKLQGVRTEIRNLRRQMDRVSLRDVIGGIGYIFGIWAIIMLIKRKKNAS